MIWFKQLGVTSQREATSRKKIVNNKFYSNKQDLNYYRVSINYTYSLKFYHNIYFTMEVSWAPENEYTRPDGLLEI